MAFQAGAEQVSGFLALTALSVALGWLTVSTALCIAVVWPDRLKAMSVALLLWLLVVVAYDLVVLGATAMLRGVPQTVLFPALLLNPIDLARVLTTLAVGSGALFGPTSAVLMKMFGSQGGVALGSLGVLAVESIVPALVALRVFQRREW